jgi:competence ComEA-like helix-hairpin-helix protein
MRSPRLIETKQAVREKLPRTRFFILLVVFTITFGGCARHENRAKTEAAAASTTRSGNNQPCVNLNQATADELKTLPGVGEITAKRIIDYRQRNGRFRRPEEIIIIQGFSEKKYRAIADLICVE